MRKSLKRTGLVLIVAASLSGCGAVGSTFSPTPAQKTTSELIPIPNTDPKAGWVQIFPGDDAHIEFSKRCDGPRIVYKVVRYETVNFTVVDNAPECA